MTYKVEFEVRDNEIDIQGIVNNANYFIYMMHVRHKFLQEELNINFSDMAKAGKNLHLISSTIEFKKPLFPDDKFYVTCKLMPEGRIRFAFEQEIRLISDNSLIAKGLNIGVCIDAKTKRPCVPEEITRVLSLNSA